MQKFKTILLKEGKIAVDKMDNLKEGDFHFLKTKLNLQQKKH